MKGRIHVVVVEEGGYIISAYGPKGKSKCFVRIGMNEALKGIKVALVWLQEKENLTPSDQTSLVDNIKQA